MTAAEKELIWNGGFDFVKRLSFANSNAELAKIASDFNKFQEFELEGDCDFAFYHFNPAYKEAKKRVLKLGRDTRKVAEEEAKQQRFNRLANLFGVNI